MNFQDLLQKIKNIDEGVNENFAVKAANGSTPYGPGDRQEIEVPFVTDSGPDASNDSATQECGMMPPMGMPMTPPSQQDSVSMNVSMNAQGKGGIRDLMDVLRNIEQSVEGGNIDNVMTGNDSGNIDADPELDIVMPSNPEGDADDDQVMVIDKEEDEAYDNQPDPSYQDNDYMQQTLAGGADEPQKMTKGGYRNADNALTMAAILPVAAAMGRMGEGLQESLQSKLQSLYTEIKERK